MKKKVSRAGTAVQISATWYIPRGWYSHLRVLMCYHNYEVEAHWFSVSTYDDWVGILLSKRDRRTLRKAEDAGVLNQVWEEMRKVRSEQYKDHLTREDERKEKAKNRLIMEVHRAN